MSWNRSHPEIPMDTNTDAHGQLYGELVAGTIQDPGFTELEQELGH